MGNLLNLFKSRPFKLGGSEAQMPLSEREKIGLIPVIDDPKKTAHLRYLLALSEAVVALSPYQFACLVNVGVQTAMQILPAKEKEMLKRLINKAIE